MTRPRKIPLRVCVGCREKKSKKELVRIVKTPENLVELDSTGKKSGRGVYICPNRECLRNASKGNRLEKNLKSRIPPEILEKLHTDIEAMK